jgi:hypothetical protein
MIAWESDVFGRGPGSTSGPPRREDAREETPPADGAGRAWRRRLWRELSLATGLYVVAHLLFSTHRASEGLPALTLDVGIAQGLFLLGTLLLWRVTRMLNDPAVARHPGQPRPAACCLALAMALSFSPCIWWFIFRL